MTISKSHFGLRPKVRYRMDIGYVFLDDGNTVFQFEDRIFKMAATGKFTESDLWIGEKYYSLFELYPTVEAAVESFIGKEV